MNKISKKRYALVALTTIIILGIATTIFLIVKNMEALAAKPTEVAFFGRSAWPEHHHFDISRDEHFNGTHANQTLYAKIKNYKNQTVYVQAEFFINPALGVPTHYTIYTEVKELTPGNYTVLTTDFGPLSADDAGTYYVSAKIWYSLDGETWIQSDDMKEFKFTIVP